VPADPAGRVARIFTADPGLTAVMGSYDASPSAPGLVSQYRNLQHHFVHQVAREEASTFWAGCGAVRRRVYQEAGGFAERFSEPSIEDIELGVRLVRQGHRIRLARDLQVRHLKRWRLGDMLATDLWRRAVPWSILMLGEGRLINDLNVRPRDRASVVLAFVAPLGLAGLWWSTAWLAAPLAAMAGIVALNARFFGFLAQRRGFLFALRAVPLYWLYLLVCGAGFGIALGRHLTAR
jgi:GT2 family glycosyltransferase